MNKQSIIIFDFEIMFNILNEIRENLEFEVFKFNKDDKITNLNINKYGNYLIVVNSSSNSLKNDFVKKLKKTWDGVQILKATFIIEK